MLSPKNKKGDFTGVLYMVVMLSAFAIFLLIAGFIATEIAGEVKTQLNSTSDDVNEAFDATTNTARNTLSTLWYIMFGGLLLGLLVTSWFIPSQPVFVPIFLVLLVITVIVGVAMSNVYEALYEVTQFSQIATTQSSIFFVMSNLPYVALIIGLIGLVVTFAKPGSAGGNTTIM